MERGAKARLGNRIRKRTSVILCVVECWADLEEAGVVSSWQRGLEKEKRRRRKKARRGTTKEGVCEAVVSEREA